MVKRKLKRQRKREKCEMNTKDSGPVRDTVDVEARVGGSETEKWMSQAISCDDSQRLICHHALITPPPTI